MSLRFFLFLGGDLDINAFGLSLALLVFKVTVIRLFPINGFPIASNDNIVIWDVKVVFFCGKFVGFPATLLYVVLDKVPKTVGEVESYGEICAFKICKVPCVVSYSCVYCVLEVSLGDITVPSLVDR